MLLRAIDLHKSYRTDDAVLNVLQGVDLSVDAGETVALTGESGSGKSTLLHILGALDTPDSGEVTLDGQDVTGTNDRGRAEIRRRLTGMVFQQYNLVPSLNVMDNLRLQARLAGRDDPGWNNALIARLGLTGQERKYPEQLSGGQQQRVAIGRALAPRPRLLLADEPTGNLDAETSDAVMSLMLALVDEVGAAFLMVTHSSRMAAMLGRRLQLSAGRIA